MEKWQEEVDHIIREKANDEQHKMIIALLREISKIFETVELKQSELEKRIIDLERSRS